MSGVIAWIAAQAENTGNPEFPVEGLPIGGVQGESEERLTDSLTETSVGHSIDLSRNGSRDPLIESLPAHQFPGRRGETDRSVGRGAMRAGSSPREAIHSDRERMDEYALEREQERRTYRQRTVAMLRRYMKYSIETGRLPSLLGREFFRAKVTSYTVVTFEDRVIFAHDMEACLERLDEFSQQLIARHILQEHDRCSTARLLRCNEKTVRRLIPLALDQLSEILLDMGLMERLDSSDPGRCQGLAPNADTASDCENGK